MLEIIGYDFFLEQQTAKQYESKRAVCPDCDGEGVVSHYEYEYGEFGNPISQDEYLVECPTCQGFGDFGEVAA